MNIGLDDYKAYLVSGSTLPIEEWLEGRRGSSAAGRPKQGVAGIPARRPSIPSTRVEIDGHKFDSKTEARRYRWLKDQPEVVHVDVHPVFTLSTGRRYRADFLVWSSGATFPRIPHPEQAMRYVIPSRKEQRDPELRIFKGIPFVAGRFWVEEVKGVTKGEAWRRFTLIREDFDAHHPLAPLRVVTWDRKAKTWREAKNAVLGRFAREGAQDAF